MVDVILIYIIYVYIFRRDINQFLDADKIVSGDSTVDLCVACKSNQIMVLDGIRTLELFQRKIHCNARWLYFPI